MTKKLFTALLVVLMAAALMLSATGCGSKQNNALDEAAAQIAQLEQENADLQAQLAELNAELNRMKQKAALQNWTLDANAWADGNGATINFAAYPVSYVEGQRAALSIRMGDLEAESTNCVWDGAAFTGSVELSAADGYSYYCILTSADGSQSEVELNSPESVSNEALVNLGSSLSAFANLMVEDWEASDSALTIKSGFVQCQMPRMTYNDMTVYLDQANLVLKLNGEEISRQPLDIPAGEGEGSFEMPLANQSMAIPAMADDYQLDLGLEIVLNTGVIVSVTGGSWYGTGSELQMVVG